MTRDDTHLAKQIAVLRWAIPLLVGCVGIAYMLFEHYVVDGHLFSTPYLITGILILGLLGPAFAWVTLDWAARAALAEAQAQKEIRRRARQLESANQVSKKITAILDVDTLLKQVVALIRETFGYYYVSLFLVNADAQEIVLREGSGEAERLLKTQRLALKIGEQGITGHVAGTGQPILCNNVHLEGRYLPSELLPGTQSEMAIPLRLGDAVLGVLDAQSDRLDAFCQDDLVVLQILADQVAVALENARLFREKRQQFEVMRVLHEMSLEIASRLETREVLSAILTQAARLLDAPASSLSLYEPAAGWVRKIAVHNLPPEFEGVTVPLSEGATGQVAQTGEPLIVNDYKKWEKRSPLFKASPFDAIVSVPLRWHGEVFGVLNVLDNVARRTFNQADLRVLVLFADLASIAFKNAELHAQVVGLSETLEQRVEERTGELEGARREVARKAEQLQRLLALTVHVQEEERARIARDLHDGSNQLVTGTTYEIQAALESLRHGRQVTALEKLEKAKELLRRLDVENSRIISGLRPPILDAQGLVPAIQAQAGAFQEQCRIPCLVHVGGQPVRLPPAIEIAVYRIVQESLNNVSAHAQAASVNIRIDLQPDHLSVAVEDDGVGFEPQAVQVTEVGQMGLIGMRERAQSIHGQITVESLPGHGTRITLRAPLPVRPGARPLKLNPVQETELLS